MVCGLTLKNISLAICGYLGHERSTLLLKSETNDLRCLSPFWDFAIFIRVYVDFVAIENDILCLVVTIDGHVVSPEQHCGALSSISRSEWHASSVEIQ
jgi:hypothetical protein